MTPQNPGKDARNEQNFGDQPESPLGQNSERNRAEQARPNQHEQTPRGQYQNGQGRYGLRFENMSAEELEYYRPFWEEKPDPDAVPPELIDHLKVRARRRLVNALSLIAVAVGVTLTLSGMLSSALYLSLPGALAFGAGIFGWVAVRRRLFAWLRLPGESALKRGERSRWWILPHVLAAAGTASILGCFSVVPMIYAHVDDTLRRNHIVMWGEIGTTLLIFAALIYGMMALGEYTQQDDDERVLRPTDYAQQKGTSGDAPQIPRYRPGMLNPRHKDDSSS